MLLFSANTFAQRTTDIDGGKDYPLISRFGGTALSENRAKAVMNELIAQYGVNKKQLRAYGVGSLSPVSSNKTEEGKAKNRRVEIVEQ